MRIRRLLAVLVASTAFAGLPALAVSGAPATVTAAHAWHPGPPSCC